MLRLGGVNDARGIHTGDIGENRHGSGVNNDGVCSDGKFLIATGDHNTVGAGKRGVAVDDNDPGGIGKLLISAI